MTFIPIILEAIQLEAARFRDRFKAERMSNVSVKRFSVACLDCWRA